MKRISLQASLLLGASFAALATGAWSQDAEQNTAAADNLDEIIVTATRRSESSLSVPLSLTALSQESLDRKGISNISDLSRTTPGVTFTPSWAGSTSISIRGISSGIGAGTTGIYIDDTPLQVRNVGAGATSSNAYPEIFDLDRVEVLRGPQGTLFGAGSQGGTIRFVTPKPSLTDYSGYGRAQLAFTDGGDPSHELGVAVGGPIIEDRVGFRLSAFNNREGGWVDRVDYPTEEVVEENSNSREVLALRAAVQFAVTDNFIVTPSVYYQDVDRDDTGQFWRQYSDPSNGVFRNGQPVRQPGSDSYTLYSVAAEWDIGAVTLFSNTSYFDRNNNSIADYSTYVSELLGADYDVPLDVGLRAPTDMINGQKVFTQELRLQSNNDSSRLRWVAGVFYQEAKQTADEYVRTLDLDLLTQALYGADAIDVFGIGPVRGDVIYLGEDVAEDKQIAAFGQIDYSFSEQLTVTAGLRYAKTDFEFANIQDGPFNGGVTAATGQQSERPLTPKIGVNYKPTENSLLYLSAAKGFRTGGANAPVSATRCAADLTALGLSAAPTSYGSDTVMSYEAGAKGRFLDRRLRFESSIFYIDWEDIQNQVGLPGCGFGFVSNLGTAVSKGFDVQLSATPADGLTLEASVGYTDAQYQETIFGAPLPGGGRGIIVADGDPLFTAPWTVSLSADYRHSLSWGHDAEGYVRADYNYSSGFDSGPGPTTVSYDPLDNGTDETHFVSARIGVRFSDIDVSLYADNLFNSHDILASGRNTRGSTLFRESTFRPRTIGMTATYRY